MRNRIVSGLSRGVLVVEAPFNSGTMITVSQALDQNRSVMAVPGRIDSPASQGCHKLLREGARLATCADDVIEELQDLMAGMRQATKTRPAEPARSAQTERPPESVLTPEERAVLVQLGVDGVSVDEVVRASGLDAGKVNALLVGLQIKRHVRVLPGGRVARRSI
jgi:DNA processing protein